MHVIGAEVVQQMWLPGRALVKRGAPSSSFCKAARATAFQAIPTSVYTMRSDRPTENRSAESTSEAEERASDDFVARSIAAQEFGEYMTESDTDTENATAPHGRRWVWLCKSPQCSKNGAAWTCKTNWLLHLYETPAHREDQRTRTREGRRALSRSWRAERAYDFSDMKNAGWDWAGTHPIDMTEIEGQPRRVGGSG